MPSRRETGKRLPWAGRALRMRVPPSSSSSGPGNARNARNARSARNARNTPNDTSHATPPISRSARIEPEPSPRRPSARAIYHGQLEAIVRAARPRKSLWDQTHEQGSTARTSWQIRMSSRVGSARGPLEEAISPPEVAYHRQHPSRASQRCKRGGGRSPKHSAGEAEPSGQDSR